MKPTMGSLFAGIGGFDLGFERAGFETKWQVEIDPYCRKVLEKNFPHAERFGDIRECGSHNLKPVDVICGGFPCQDLSCAGSRRGIAEGTRSGLWSEFARIVGEVRPRFVCVENVTGLLANEPMRRVLGDFSALGFDAEWRVFGAHEFGAWHERERVFLVAYPSSLGREVSIEYLRFDPAKSYPESRYWQEVLVPPRLQRVVDGVPRGLDRLRALGNAVVPQIPEMIAHRIKQALEATCVSA